MIQGEIENFHLTDLIQWLGITRRTGLLTITQGDRRIEFYFDAGKIAAVSSSDFAALNSYDYACSELVTALAWRYGSFVFNDCPLPDEVAAASLRLSPETLLLEVLHQSGEEPEPDDDPALKDWVETGKYSDIFTLADALRLKVIDRLLKGDYKIPPMPHLAARVFELTRDDNFSMRELGNLIQTDQTVTAQILRQANSALRGGQRTIDTLPMAVQRLGSDEVVNIVLTVSLHAPRPGRDLFAAHKRRLWARSATSAFFARAIASQVRLDHNVAFLCGLLMDFGMTVLYSLIQDVLGRVSRLEEAQGQVIAHIVNDYHPAIGRVVGERWRLPQPVVDSMAYHHRIDAEASGQPYVAVSALADFLAVFALNRPRAELEEALSTIPPERLISHPAALLAKLDHRGAEKVLADLPRQLDLALELVAD